MLLRKEAGLNQSALAARLRITQSEVSKYERGERVLNETRLRAWLSALGQSSEALDVVPCRPVGEKSFSPSTSRGRSRRRSGR